MSSSNETDRGRGRSDDASDDNARSDAIATSPSDGDGAKKKKKRPLQHLVAGGTAGLVESSVCHPLDTIKTRMQLRRQNTVRARALGSAREVAGRRDLGLRRPAGEAAGGAAGGGAGDATVKDGAKGHAAARVEPVPSEGKLDKPARVQPDPSEAKLGTSTARSAPHDVGWKQRLPPGPSSAAAGATSGTAAGPAAKSAGAATPAPRPAAQSSAVVASLGPLGTARRIFQREGPTALYKGLTAVYTGIVPKMAIRFVSFEYYRDVLTGWHGQYYDAGAAPATPPPAATFFAGLLAGLTEAVAIVTPAEVCKIRMQSQYHSLMDPSQVSHTKYKNVVQTAMLVVREEGVGALYKGVVPTMLRQGCNQAVNFTAYNWSKRRLLAWKRKRREEEGRAGASGEDVQLDHWQSLLLGGLSGGMGPLVNNPLDVVKTRMQKQVIHPGKEPKYRGLLQSCVAIAKEEGTPALWRGITPRLMRVMPGQAITFMTYEAVSARMERYGAFD